MSCKERFAGGPSDQRVTLQEASSRIDVLGSVGGHKTMKVVSLSDTPSHDPFAERNSGWKRRATPNLAPRGAEQRSPMKGPCSAQK